MQMNKVKFGIVAFFDILGFSQFAAVETDREIAEAAEKLRGIILEIPEKVAKSEEIPHHYLSGIEWRIISDSILLSKEFSPDDYEWFHWLAFFRVCNGLMKLTFDYGFPLRGAISTGTFYIEKHSFVGKPIIDCHELSSCTQWAGCVVAPAAQEKLQQIYQKKKTMEQVCVRYDVPMHGKERIERADYTKSLFTLKWFHDDLWRAPADIALRIPNVVWEKFKAHKKEIPHSSDVMLKVGNTIKFLEFVDSLYYNSNEKRGPLNPND
jgi:hypothetical protein